MKKYACMGNCGTTFTMMQILNGEVMRVRGEMNRPMCGACIQKALASKRARVIPEKK